MGDLIQLFGHVKNDNVLNIDITQLAFSSIKDLRARARPLVTSAAAEGRDQVILRTFNIMAAILLNPSNTEESAHAAGWGSLARQRLQGFEILSLVNELWNESISVSRSES